MQHIHYLSIMPPLDWWVTTWERKLPQLQWLKEIFFIFSPINLQIFKEASSKRICIPFILYNTLSISSVNSLRHRADNHLLLSSSIKDRKNLWGGGTEHHFLLLTEYKQLPDWHKTPSSDYIHALESSFLVTKKTITQFCRDMESWVASHCLAYFLRKKCKNYNAWFLLSQYTKMWYKQWLNFLFYVRTEGSFK